MKTPQDCRGAGGWKKESSHPLAVIILRDTHRAVLSSCCLALHVIFGTRLA